MIRLCVCGLGKQQAVDTHPDPRVDLTIELGKQGLSVPLTQ